MASQLSRDAGSHPFSSEVAAAMSPAGLAQYRIDRLLELRAVIDSLRGERGEDLVLDARSGVEHGCCS